MNFSYTFYFAWPTMEVPIRSLTEISHRGLVTILDKVQCKKNRTFKTKT